MNLLPWMMLVFLLSAGTNLADVDVDWLTRTVQAITTHVRSQYGITGHYCLAANIPLSGDQNTLGKMLWEERGVKDTVETQNQVYTGNSIVIAKPENKGQNYHAEFRVLTNLQKFSGNRKNNFLLIYSFLSPCGQRCANPNNDNDNILQYLTKENLSPWGNYAFVFTTVFDKPRRGGIIHKKTLINTMQDLGNSGLGLENIYRCFKPENFGFQCYSCSSEQTVSEVCVDNNFKPGQGGSRNILGDNRGRDRHSSRSRSSSRRRDNNRGRDRHSSKKRGRDRSRSRSQIRRRDENRGGGGSRSINTGRDRGRSRSSSRRRGYVSRD
ncbi:uncharacterized protein LOC123978996 [Micropterus dolomieu]|uniref:uncharacterized protein LOC123978996 n=1 Tax=Micropterus dolomieu TaxID=147949 RepID=UPI001E8E2795|nr:uncharacterized protein LOC123978996 [Micropterus dolomieu]